MEQSNEKELFRLPKNVRQIGQVDTKIKLYVEDYVMTLFRQLARRSSMEYQMAVLLGTVRTSSNCKYIFISGAVEVHELMLTEDSEFTEDTWSGIYGQIKEYFKEEELLGWYLTRPGLIDIPDEKMTKIHEKNFPGEEKVMILFDSLGERENLYITQNSDLKRLKGYFIYYEKNPNMQEYMIAQSENRSIENGYNDELMRRLRRCTNKTEKEKTTQNSPIKQRKRGETGKWGYAVAAAAVFLVIAVGVGAKLRLGHEQGSPVAKNSKQTVPASSDITATDQIENTLKQLQGVNEQDPETSAAETQASGNELGDWERYQQPENELQLPSVQTDPQQEDKKDRGDKKNPNAQKDGSEEDAEGNGTEENNTEGNNTEGNDTEGNDTEENDTEGNSTEGNDTEENDTEGNDTAEDDTEAGPQESSGSKEGTTDENAGEEAISGQDNMKPDDTPQEQIYIVRKGDTLASISMKMYQTTSKTELIQEANDIEDVDLIFIGQKLVIPN